MQVKAENAEVNDLTNPQDMINVLTKIKMEIFRSALDNHWKQEFTDNHSVKKASTVTTMLTHTWKCKVLHCNHLGNTWKNWY